MSTLRSNKHSVIYQSTLYRPVLCTTDEGQAWPPTHAHGADETAMGKDKKDVDNSNTSGRAESNSIPLRNGHINGQLTNNSNVSHDPSFTDGKLLPNGRILTLNHQPLQDKPTEPVSTCRKAAETVNTKSPLRGTQNTDTSPKTNGTTRHPPSIPQKETSSHMGKMNGSKRRYSRLLLKRQQEDNSLSTVKTGEAEVDELMYETNHIRNRKADNRPLTVGVKQGRASSVETEERSGTWKPNVDKCDSGEQGVEKTTKGQTGSRNGSNASETETKAIFKAVPVEKHSSSDENRPRDPDTSHIFISKEVVASCRENDHGKPVADKGASCRENDHGKPAANNGAIKASHHHTNTKPDVPWGSNNTEASSVLVPDEQPTTVTTGGHNTDNRTQEINLSDRNHARSLPLTRKGGKTARKNLIKSRDKVENFDDSTVPTTVDNDHVATDDAAKSDSTDRELHDSERSQKGLSSVSKPHRNTIQSDTEDGSCINNNTFRDETLINRSITIKSPSTVPTNHPATYRAGTGNSVHQELVSEISTQSTDAKPDRNVNFKQTSHVDRDLITMPGGHSSVSSINEPSTSREGELPKKNGVVKNSRSTQRVRFSPSTGPRTSEDTSPPGGAVLQVTNSTFRPFMPDDPTSRPIRKSEPSVKVDTRSRKEKLLSQRRGGDAEPGTAEQPQEDAEEPVFDIVDALDLRVGALDRVMTRNFREERLANYVQNRPRHVDRHPKLQRLKVRQEILMLQELLLRLRDARERRAKAWAEEQARKVMEPADPEEKPKKETEAPQPKGKTPNPDSRYMQEYRAITEKGAALRAKRLQEEQKRKGGHSESQPKTGDHTDQSRDQDRASNKDSHQNQQETNVTSDGNDPRERATGHGGSKLPKLFLTPRYVRHGRPASQPLPKEERSFSSPRHSQTGTILPRLTQSESLVSRKNAGQTTRPSGRGTSSLDRRTNSLDRRTNSLDRRTNSTLPGKVVKLRSSHRAQAGQRSSVGRMKLWSQSSEKGAGVSTPSSYNSKHSTDDSAIRLERELSFILSVLMEERIRDIQTIYGSPWLRNMCKRLHARTERLIAKYKEETTGKM